MLVKFETQVPMFAYIFIILAYSNCLEYSLAFLVSRSQTHSHAQGLIACSISARAYTASDKALRVRMGLATRDYRFPIQTIRTLNLIFISALL